MVPPNGISDSMLLLLLKRHAPHQAQRDIGGLERMCQTCARTFWNVNVEKLFSVGNRHIYPLLSPSLKTLQFRINAFLYDSSRYSVNCNFLSVQEPAAKWYGDK